MRFTAIGALVLVIAVMFTLQACPVKDDGLTGLSAGFQKNHEFESLSRLAGHLRLDMARAKIERLLGRPDYSPIAGQYYYASSDRKTAEGTPVGLIVEYRRMNVRAGEEIMTGRLESMFLGPIGE